MSARFRDAALQGVARYTAGLAASARRLPHNLDLIVLIVALLAGAVGAVVLAAAKSGAVLAHLASSVAARGADTVEIRRTYLVRDEYQEYAPTVVRLNPGVQFSLNQDGTALVMSIASQELYPDLMMALHTLQAFKPGVAWEMVEFCAHRCGDNAVVARAVVKGFTQEIGR